jgi:hypothetical protein
MIAKGVSERKGKEVQRVYLAKDVEWQAWFKELAEQGAKLSKARRQDAESITEVKTMIASCGSIALLVREKIVEAMPRAPPSLPPIGGHRVRDPSPSPLLENIEEPEAQRCSP